MPRHPHTARATRGITASAYSRLAHRLAGQTGEVYPLHVGDTYLQPPAGCRMQDLTVEDHPGLHRYTSPQGLQALREAIAARVEARTDVPTRADDVLVTAGATGGLGATIGALVEPGDEVILTAPYWPLIEGIVRSFHATPVTVPFYGAVRDGDQAADAIRAAITPRTVALYLSSPNNPSGLVAPPEVLRAAVTAAEKAGLWVITDEVYEDYAYRGDFLPLRPLAPERTFAAHSFSKAYGMAGNRCGYIVGPRAFMPTLCKVSTHTFYSTPTAAQVAALKVLEGRGEAWLASTRARYQAAGDAAADRLGLPRPEGGTFLFLDVAPHLDERGLDGLLEDLAEKRLLLAPGPSFGPYPSHVRICFTCSPPDVVARGVDILARHLGIPG